MKKTTSALTVALGLLIAACGSTETATPTPPPAAPASGPAVPAPTPSGEPIKIGLINSYDGSFADLIEAAHSGAEVAVEQINADGGINGRPVEIVRRADQQTPDGAVSAMRELLDQDIELFIGALLTPICNALGELATERDVVFIALHCTANSVTGPNRPANLFRMSNWDENMNYALGEIMASEYPDIKVYDVFGYDYETGRGFWEVSRTAALAAGATFSVGEEHWVPLAEQNYRPQVQSLARAVSAASEDRGVFLGTFGNGTAAFIQQAQPLGILDEYDVIAASGTYYPVARELQGAAPRVLNGYDYWDSCFSNPLNDRFVGDFRAKTGVKPIAVAHHTYTSIYFLKAAIEKAGDASSEGVMSTLPGLEIDTIMGRVTMDADRHQAMVPAVVTLSEGDAASDENVKTIECWVVPARKLS